MLPMTTGAIEAAAGAGIVCPRAPCLRCLAFLLHRPAGHVEISKAAMGREQVNDLNDFAQFIAQAYLIADARRGI